MTTFAIIGGSFDPVHLGHLSFARDILAQTSVDTIVFMPAKQQPFKMNARVTPFDDRYEMLKIACEEYEDMIVSPLEDELEGVSYTYRTLDEFRDRIDEDDLFFFVTGSDSFLHIDTWMEAEHLLRNNRFIIGVRPGYPTDELEAKRKELRERFGTVSIVIDNEPHDISSTMIRKLAREGKSLDKLVTEGVEKYIITKDLYRSYVDEETRKRILEELTEKRRVHTMGVLETALSMADRFGADPAKVDTAVICHDMYRGKDIAELDALIDELGIEARYKGNANLSHSKIAAAVMKRDLGITDEDILDAVSYHTTGRAGMSLLEKIVFLADAIEEGRDYPGVNDIRAKAQTDLDAACLMSLEGTIAFLKAQGVTDIDEDTVKARDSLKKEIEERGN